MKIEFVKYHGTGNDFILINGMAREFPKELFTQSIVAHWCHRRFGIGADGLIILLPDVDADFYMWYFNSDGRPSSMCGNGSRCALHFAQNLGLFKGASTFKAADGLHQGRIHENVISVQMNIGEPKKRIDGDYVVDTGSPHYVRYVPSIADIDIRSIGRQVRESEEFIEEGINVNFVEVIGSNHLKVATYERGVEDETYSCGTGVTACAIIERLRTSALDGDIKVLTKGGELSVRFTEGENGDSEVWLNGPAVPVFEGILGFDM